MRYFQTHKFLLYSLKGIMFLSSLLLFSLFSLSQTIWLEDFTLSDGTTVDGGATAWSIDVSGGDPNTFSVQGNEFFCRANSNLGELIWISEPIDISGGIPVKISIYTRSSGTGLDPPDYLRMTYQVDGGDELEFFRDYDDYGTNTPSVSGVLGSSLVIRVYTFTSATDEYYVFDNVHVEEFHPTILYSRASDNWHDVNTWSLISGGPPAGITPDSETEVHIEGGHTVNIDNDADATSIYIENGGTLRWTSDTDPLTLYNNGILSIESSGVLDKNGYSGSHIYIASGSTSYTIDNDGSVLVNDISLYDDNSILNITGSSTITADNLNFRNTEGILRVSNGSIVDLSGNIYNYNGNNSLVIDAGGSLNFVSFYFQDKAFVISNNGTVNQSGNFSNANGTESVNNLFGATWNWNGSSYDSDLKLYCDIDGENTFNYSRSGNQTIIDPEDAYWNIGLSGSGTKTASGSFDVKGDWTNNNVTFQASSTTTTFNGTNDQQISKIGGTEQFNNFLVNKTSGSLTLNDNVTVNNIFILTTGVIQTGGNTFYMSNSSAALNYSGGFIVGRFGRAVAAGTYHFPVGVSQYNGIFLEFGSSPGGIISSEFVSGDPGNNGFPVDDLDVGDQVYYQFTEGYWKVDHNLGSGTNYKVTLDASGFTSYTIDADTRVIHREDGGAWTDPVPGTHGGSLVRNTVTDAILSSPSATEFGVGHPICELAIDSNPIDVTGLCPETQSQVQFSITASGGGTIYYQWYKMGFPDIQLSEGGDISGATSATLTIDNIELAHEGSYFCVIDNFCYPDSLISDTALLELENVSPTFTRPADITIYKDASCNYNASTAVTGDVMDEADNCDTSLDATYGDVVTAGSCEGEEVITRTWTLTDDCGNSTSHEQIITATDTVSPTFTRPEADTICRDLNCNYSIDILFTGDVTDEDDNCTTVLDAIYSDDFSHLTSCDTAGYVIRRWMLSDDCGNTTVKNQILWVEPTPQVDLSRQNADIFCTGLTTDVLINSVTQSMYGVRFRYVVEPYNPVDVDITYSGSTSSLVKNDVLQDTIINLSDTIQPVNIIVTPYTIDRNGNEKCTGVNDTIYYEITPRLRMHDWSKTYVFDTLNIRCFHDSSGVIFLNSTGGITAYPTYDFYDLDYFFEGTEEFGDSVYHLPAGTYNLHVEDWSGCQADTSITLNEPDSLWSELLLSADIICEGETADFLIVPHGGTYYNDGSTDYGYLVEWIEPVPYPGPPYPNPLIGASFGQYFWEVTDSNRCITAGSEYFRTGNIGISVGFGEKEYGISCYGYDDGEVVISANTSGSKTLIYRLYDSLWNQIDMNITTSPLQVFSSYGPEKFYVTVESPEGCVSTDSLIMTQPDELIIADTSISWYHSIYNISCSYSEDGWIRIEEVTGGYENYSYEWEKDGIFLPETDLLLENLSEGNYHVKVFDSVGCFDTMSITLIAPPEIEVTVDSINIDCFGENTGTILLSGSGGIGALTYYWPDIDTYGPEIINLSADTYIYTVTDEVSCFYTDSVILEESPDFIVDASIFENHGVQVSCFSGNDGRIEITSSGATGIHSYSWEYNGTPMTETTNLIEYLTAGTYNLTITDELLCEYEDSYTLNQPDPLEFDGTVTNKICEDYGTVVSDINGGIPFSGDTYEVIWSNGSTTYDLDGLLPGTYRITITDINTCTLVDSVVVGEDSPMEIEIFIVDSVQCNGYSNGQLGVRLTNYTDPLNYVWSQPGITNPTLENVSAGHYSITVTDAHDCVSQDAFDMPEPEILESNLFVDDVHCYDSADASVLLNATGGNGGYYYLWNDVPVDGDYVEYQPAGEHLLTIFDRKECQLEETVVINQPEQIVIYVEEGDIISPDCEFSLNGEITVTVEGGTPPYMYNWPDVDNSSSNHVESLGVGEYIVVVTDNQNCVTDQLFTLEKRLPACLDIPTAFSPNNDGRNDMWIILNPSNMEIPISEIYPQMIVEVFDRYGQKRWISAPGYTNSTETGWNGEDMRGQLLPVDTYYYFIYLNNSTGLVIQDIITIIR